MRKIVGERTSGGRVANLCRLVDQFSGRSRRSSNRQEIPWGDGLSDLSLATLYYPTDWAGISEDELVFVNPWLVRSWTRSGDQATGPARFLRRPLCAHVYRYVEGQIDENAGTASSQRAAVIDNLARSGVITTLSVAVAWRDGREISAEWFGHAEQRGLRNSCLPVVTASKAPREQDRSSELLVLSLLDRLLADVSGPLKGACVADPTRDALAEALLVSIHCCFNAAYVWSKFACMHELLTVGAWLGQLVRGRSAWLPASIAMPLIALLNRVGSSDAISPDSCDNIVAFYAQAGGGARYLLRQANWVRRTGMPVVVRPRDLRAFVSSDFLVSKELTAGPGPVHTRPQGFAN